MVFIFSFPYCTFFPSQDIKVSHLALCLFGLTTIFHQRTMLTIGFQCLKQKFLFFGHLSAQKILRTLKPASSMFSLGSNTTLAILLFLCYLTISISLAVEKGSISPQISLKNPYRGV